MTYSERKKVVDALNSLEIIESQGGEEGYAIFEINDENRATLNAVGLTDDVIHSYGDDETSCILAIGFGEGYADLYTGNELIVYEEKVELELETGVTTIFYKYRGIPHVVVASDNGSMLIKKLTEEQVSEIRKFIA